MLPSDLRRPSRQQAFFLGALALLLMANAALLLVPESSLPKALTVRSGGFAFPALGNSGQSARNLWLIGAVIAVAMMSRLQSGAWVARRAWPQWFTGRDTVFLSAAAAFLLGACLAYPPQISATNFRIIWVDWAGTDAKVRYFGQILRQAFYSYPHLLQGLATLGAFLGFQGIARRFGYGAGEASIAALLTCASSVFVEFAGIGEDWTLVSAGSIVALWAYAARRWGPLVVALVVLGGLRLPSAIILMVAITLAEGLRLVRVAQANPARAGGLVWLCGGRVAIAWLAVGLLSYLGYMHFTPLGDDLGRDVPLNLDKLAVDGFVLAPLSGVYLAHAVWAMPAVVLAACVAIVFAAPRYAGSTQGRVALAAALAMGGTLLFYEAFVEFQFYYNYRYLALAYPFGIVALLFVLARFGYGRLLAGVVLAALLAWNPTMNVWRPLAGQLSDRQQMEHELYSCREVFAPWLAQRNVYVTQGGKALPNAIEYIKDLQGADTTSSVRRLKAEGQRFTGRDVVLLQGRSATVRKYGLDRATRVATCRSWTILNPR